MAENKLPFPIALEKNTNRESTAFGKNPMTHAVPRLSGAQMSINY